ncbi:hypothetical protein T484DRAFT_1945959 [Baffinella frigidus]|nr:hypothetical protein T484DRAFT_1945959 [Cryptophyta sp. CCMP2293]
MPWRHCIFTDAGIVYPPSWDMNTDKGRTISASMVCMGLPGSASLDALPPQGPSDRIATQDIFSRRDAAPWSPAAPSLTRTDERAAPPDATSPCNTLPRCASPACSERHTRGGCRSLSPLATRGFPDANHEPRSHLSLPAIQPLGVVPGYKE